MLLYPEKAGHNLKKVISTKVVCNYMYSNKVLWTVFIRQDRTGTYIA